MCVCACGEELATKRLYADWGCLGLALNDFRPDPGGGNRSPNSYTHDGLEHRKHRIPTVDATPCRTTFARKDMP